MSRSTPAILLLPVGAVEGIVTVTEKDPVDPAVTLGRSVVFTLVELMNVIFAAAFAQYVLPVTLTDEFGSPEVGLSEIAGVEAHQT